MIQQTDKMIHIRFANRGLHVWPLVFAIGIRKTAGLTLGICRSQFSSYRFLHAAKHLIRSLALLVAIAVLLLQLGRDPVLSQDPTMVQPVIATTSHLQSPSVCQNAFIPRDLDHVTTTEDGIVRMFEANGSGLAVGDLDNDGDLDLVLGSLHGPNSTLWNEGDLTFRTDRWGKGQARAVTIVDVDGDGWRDIVLTTNIGSVNYWRNQSDGTFERELLPGVTQPAYTINWADLDNDGDLDLVAAPYDAGFLTDRGNDYLLNGGSAVYVYTNEEGRFIPTRLTPGGQALALALLDLNDDERIDILVGNDFGVPDFAFVQDGDIRHGDGWQAFEPFEATAHSTMSFDAGDLNNDGHWELFATDMKPYTFDDDMMAAYEPLMAGMDEENQVEGDPQIMENVLQVYDGRSFENHAAAWRVDGTGWSWSSKFGDLDNDGYLDLYAVNGMIEEGIFAHMPDHELVEENQVFRNDNGQHFVSMPDWGLDTIHSGRAMSMADLDDDGDLDVVVNNLRAPAQLFENRLCAGASLVVELIQPDAQNRSAIGAKLGLLTENGMLYRDIRAASGYLSGDPSRAHFGFPADTELGYLEIQWPDGAVSVVEKLQLDSFVRVERQ